MGMMARGGRWLQAEEVAANNGFGLNDGFAAEDDVLSAVDEAAAGDFVAGVLLPLLAECIGTDVVSLLRSLGI